MSAACRGDTISAGTARAIAAALQEKPEKLFAKLVLASSAPGDLILDPFAGSGTTAVVAKKLGRRFTTVEKSELYCAWTRLRLENAEKDPRIQGYENGEFLKK